MNQINPKEKKTFLTKLKEILQQEWNNIKENKTKSLITFLTNMTTYTIIILISLYFLTKPYECTLNNNQTIGIEEWTTQNYKEIRTCKYTIINDIQQINQNYWKNLKERAKQTTETTQTKQEETQWKPIWTPNQTLNP